MSHKECDELRNGYIVTIHRTYCFNVICLKVYRLILIFAIFIIIYMLYCAIDNSNESIIISRRINIQHLTVDSSIIKPYQTYLKHPSINASDVFFDEIHSIWAEIKPLCSAPTNVNPHDPFVKLWYSNADFKCPFKNPLTHLDQKTGQLTVNTTLDVICFYSHISRSTDYEAEVYYSEVYPLNNTNNVFLDQTHTTANVSCLKDGRVIYENTHMYIPVYVPKSVSKQFANANHENQSTSVYKDANVKPNVLIFFLESLSQGSFERSMASSKAVLQSIGNFTTFKYFVKPQENSFPNTIALLTGENVSSEREETLKHNYFDNAFKYLWEYFRDAGYVTGILEDMARISVFTYGKWGFKEQPVDFYPRPYWLQMYPDSYQIMSTFLNTSHFCFNNNGKKVNLFLDQMLHFINKQTHPFFLFSFYSQMTHNVVNSFSWLDDDLADFFTKLKPHLNNTIVLFAGDHGLRGSTYVATPLGRVESRMNLVTLRIPDLLHRKYPHLRKFLEKNTYRLITWFDIHLMLREFSTGEFTLFPSLDSYGSLNTPTNPTRQLIHPYRTCSTANIAPQYCVCNDIVGAGVGNAGSHLDVKPAGRDLVLKINDLIDANKFNCHKQTYDTTLAFQYYLPVNGISRMARARVKILLSPSSATVESFMRKRVDTSFNSKWFVDESMNRVYNLSLVSMVEKSLCTLLDA